MGDALRCAELRTGSEVRTKAEGTAEKSCLCFLPQIFFLSCIVAEAAFSSSLECVPLVTVLLLLLSRVLCETLATH